jgi:hypothetical protein
VIPIKRLNKHEKKLAELINISNTSIEQHPNANIDINVDVYGRTLSVKTCLQFILKATSTIRSIFEVSHGNNENMSKTQRQHLAIIVDYQHRLAKALLKDSSLCGEC